MSLRLPRKSSLWILVLMASSAGAQGVYRHVGPDGRVTFSDQPPATASAQPSVSASAGGSANGNGSLPYELRQVSGRYPVTLFTSKDCAPCNSGRNLLNARGIPYTEKSINTAQDVEALKRLSGESGLPLLTIGNQQLKGYSDGEWTRYLDAAGYPQQSQLPSGYRRPASTPLVAVKAAESTPAKATPTTRVRPVEVPVAPPVNNPAGIRF